MSKDPDFTRMSPQNQNIHQILQFFLRSNHRRRLPLTVSKGTQIHNFVFGRRRARFPENAKN